MDSKLLTFLEEHLMKSRQLLEETKILCVRITLLKSHSRSDTHRLSNEEISKALQAEKQSPKRYSRTGLDGLFWKLRRQSKQRKFYRNPRPRGNPHKKWITMVWWDTWDTWYMIHYYRRSKDRDDWRSVSRLVSIRGRKVLMI